MNIYIYNHFRCRVNWIAIVKAAVYIFQAYALQFKYISTHKTKDYTTQQYDIYIVNFLRLSIQLAKTVEKCIDFIAFGNCVRVSREMFLFIDCVLWPRL